MQKIYIYSFMAQYKQQNCSGVLNLILLKNSSFIPSYSFQSRHSSRMGIPSLIKSSNHQMKSFYICFSVINFRYKRNSLLLSYWSLMNSKVKSDSNLNEELIILINTSSFISNRVKWKCRLTKEYVYAYGVGIWGGGESMYFHFLLYGIF